MITKPKGTYDLYGSEGRKVLLLRSFFEELMDKYNYEYFRTPLFESSDLFHRGVGETTDIVTKETYDFKDRGDRNITLRPEGTAGIARCFIENKLYSDPSIPKKTWYFGPMYRYERPQSGRYREHYQFGCEVFGSNDPLTDAEIISIPVTIFRLLGLKGIKVNINSLGDQESRKAYHDALIEYLEPNIDKLCDDCKERFKKNPMRILDCKVDKDSDILKNVPKTLDYLNEESKTRFEKVLEYLDALEIDYVVNPNTVRGLDYYTHTVFEVEADIKDFGAQNVMCGGGRYNNLIENIGGPSTPAVGFGMGTERLLMALDHEGIELVGDNAIDCYIMPLSENEKSFGIALCNSLRILGFKTDMDYQGRTLKANFKQAERLGSHLAIIIGEEELKNKELTIKNMRTKEEVKVDNNDIISYIAGALEDIYHEHHCDCDDGCCSHDECHCDDECNCNHDCTCGDDCACTEDNCCSEDCTCNK